MSIDEYRGVLSQVRERMLYFSLTVDPGSTWSAAEAGQMWSRYPGQIWLIDERVVGSEEDVNALLKALGYPEKKSAQTIANAVSIANQAVRKDFREEGLAQTHLYQRQYLYYGQIRGRTVKDLLPTPARRAKYIPLTERLANLEPGQYLNVSNFDRNKGTGAVGPRPYPTGGTLHALYPGDAGIDPLAFPFAANNLRGYLEAISVFPDARDEHANEIAGFISFFDKPRK